MSITLRLMREAVSYRRVSDLHLSSMNWRLFQRKRAPLPPLAIDPNSVINETTLDRSDPIIPPRESISIIEGATEITRDITEAKLWQNLPPETPRTD
jgi:hypothetical protein